MVAFEHPAYHFFHRTRGAFLQFMRISFIEFGHQQAQALRVFTHLYIGQPVEVAFGQLADRDAVRLLRNNLAVFGGFVSGACCG